MTPEEILAEQWTEGAWYLARTQWDLEFYQRSDAVKQECDFCKELVGLGYILVLVDGKCKCLNCRIKDR